MGFLKRIFSLGSKKHKKQASTTQDPLPPIPLDEEQKRKLEEEHEEAVGRLLRSSSSRYAVVKEVDYSSLPPLPHPINDVLAQNSQKKEPTLHPSPSSTSLASTAASSTLSRQSTFSVTVHDRKRHCSTTFPNANCDLSDTPRAPLKVGGPDRTDNTPHAGLRSDPSVVSLLEMYDERGQLPPEAFSNSPEKKKGRPQKRRNGSTFRELLGGSGSKDNSVVESDISWAERFLGEAESASSCNSSYGPHTPKCSNDLSHDRMHFPKPYDITMPTSLEPSTTVDDSALTSMEVEVGTTSDNSSILGHIAKPNGPYKNMDPTTPQRASQVFSFLTKRNTIVEHHSPARPSSALSSLSDNHLSVHAADVTPRAPTRTGFGVFRENVQTPIRYTQGGKGKSTDSNGNGGGAPSEQPEREVHVLMAGPTKIMVTAPTPGTNANTPSRIPIRGPRAPPSKRRSSASPRHPPMLTNRISSGGSSSSSRNSKIARATAIPSRPHKRQRRNMSYDSTASGASSIAEADAMATVCVMDQLARSKMHHHTSSPNRNSAYAQNHDKENQHQPRLTAKTELPATPVRSSTAPKSSLLRKVVTPMMFQPPIEIGANGIPEPNSSSELSPIGKQMMTDVRRQRMRARDLGKERRGGRRAA